MDVVDMDSGNLPVQQFKRKVMGKFLCKNEDYEPGFTHFIIVRNPYIRFVSAFIDKFSGLSLRLSSYNACRRKIIVTFLQNLNLNLQNSFNDVLDVLEDKIEDVKINPHFRRQTDYYDFNNIDFDYIMKTESLEKEFNQMCKKLRIPGFNVLKNKVRNSRPRATINSSKDLSNEKLINIVDMGIMGIDNLLTKKTEKKIYNIFKQDFEQLEYKKRSQA